MKKHPVLFWTVMGIVAFVCVCTGVYMTLRVFLGNPNSLPPTVTVTPSLTGASPTPLPSVTRVVATVIPGLTNSPTVAPSVTAPPTARPSATVVQPTVKPSATSVQSTPVPSATNVQPTPTVNPVQNIIWQWLIVTERSTGVQTNIPNPGNYTISFYSDGSLSGVADCNSFGGTYSQSNGLKINIGAITSTFCGEGSLDQEYLQLLSNVVSGGPDGAGGLALETAGGEQRMVFANGGAAVKP